jgi:hypothetical protein
MAENRDAAENAVLELITKIATSSVTDTVKARPLRDLAEAYAWLRAPSQPHGGSGSGSSDK